MRLSSARAPAFGLSRAGADGVQRSPATSHASFRGGRRSAGRQAAPIRLTLSFLSPSHTLLVLAALHISLCSDPLRLTSSFLRSEPPPSPFPSQTDDERPSSRADPRRDRDMYSVVQDRPHSTGRTVCLTTPGETVVFDPGDMLTAASLVTAGTRRLTPAPSESGRQFPSLHSHSDLT